MAAARWPVEEQLRSDTIQKRLTARAVPTSQHNLRGWSQSSVIEILRDPIYKGEAYYNRTIQAVSPLVL